MNSDLKKELKKMARASRKLVLFLNLIILALIATALSQYLLESENWWGWLVFLIPCALIRHTEKRNLVEMEDVLKLKNYK